MDLGRYFGGPCIMPNKLFGLVRLKSKINFEKNDQSQWKFKSQINFLKTFFFFKCKWAKNTVLKKFDLASSWKEKKLERKKIRSDLIRIRSQNFENWVRDPDLIQNCLDPLQQR